jgi:phosphoribosylaminoimidazole-succinocarboxamide synthase
MALPVDPKLLIHNILESTDFPALGTFYKGKVRDIYKKADIVFLISTDRQSAFDISWCSVPLKGQVLNQISAWWCNKTKHVVPNHFIDSPDPNVSIVKNLTMFPIEVVVRGYLAGSTETSAWMNYNRGVRYFCGNELPDGLQKNQQLPNVIITPTIKSAHDELIDPSGIIEQGLATEEEWQSMASFALKLFAEGQRIAKQQGLILVDTKYEFGRDIEGVIKVGDEIHTPDSSRYWIQETYAERFANGLEPESLDKEFFRRWLVEAGFNPAKGKAQKLPVITEEIQVNLSLKYIALYEKITREKFIFPSPEPVLQRISNNLQQQNLI